MGLVALKIDIIKAYDRMEWTYHEQILVKLGFANTVVSLLMMCVKFVIYKVSVGRELVGPSYPSKGLRQGDPLSPYLFILCMEGLSIMLQKFEGEGALHGAKAAINAPMISHLFFADDSLLFFRADEREAIKVKDVLHEYEMASGQSINFQKSSMMFSKNTTLVNKNMVVNRGSGDK